MPLQPVICEVALELAQALAHLHSKNIIHGGGCRSGSLCCLHALSATCCLDSTAQKGQRSSLHVHVRSGVWASLGDRPDSNCDTGCSNWRLRRYPCHHRPQPEQRAAEARRDVPHWVSRQDGRVSCTTGLGACSAATSLSHCGTCRRPQQWMRDPRVLRLLLYGLMLMHPAFHMLTSTCVAACSQLRPERHGANPEDPHVQPAAGHAVLHRARDVLQGRHLACVSQRHRPWLRCRCVRTTHTHLAKRPAGGLACPPFIPPGKRRN